MTTPTDARATLLQGLEAIQSAHAHDPERRGLEAVRLLRMAGLTWRDVLGLPFPPDDGDPMGLAASDRYTLRLIIYGHAPPRLTDYGRAVMTFLHLATPAECATVAVLVNRPNLTPAEHQQLVSIAWKLLAARDAALAPAASNLSRSA